MERIMYQGEEKAIVFSTKARQISGALQPGLYLGIICSLVALFTFSESVAETVDTISAENATLADYLAFAEENSPAVSAAYHSWQAALARAPQVGSLPDPKLGYAEQFESVETRVGAQQRKFSFSQSMPWFGKLGLRKSVALEKANAAEQRYIARKLQLQAQVTNLYFELYYLDQSISIVKDNLTLINEWEKVAQAKYRSAILSQGKLAQIQIEQARLSDDLASQQHRFEELIVAFNSVLNRSSTERVSLVTKPEVVPVALSDDGIVSLALERSPLLHEKDKLILASIAGVKLANRGPAPNLTFGVDYIQTDEALAPNVFESGKDPLIAKVGLSIPLWFGKYKAEKREARAHNKSALERRQDTENNLRSALSTQFFALHDAERKIDLYQNAMIPRAEQALNVIQREFETGKTDFRNLIDLQRELFTYLLTLQRSLTNYRKSVANIEALAGAPITQ